VPLTTGGGCERTLNPELTTYPSEPFHPADDDIASSGRLQHDGILREQRPAAGHDAVISRQNDDASGAI
jgi:hypothetical protein